MSEDVTPAPTRRLVPILAGLAIVIFVVVVMTSVRGSKPQANTTDGAFITGMVPHHQAAIEMARIARARATHASLRRLADTIVSEQENEIQFLEATHQQAFGSPIPPGGHGSLGLSDEAMGMTGDPAALQDARPFDRAFIDMMIGHHQGAIRMARVELARGSYPDAKDLARSVIKVQSAEIRELNGWRREWFGRSSPAGGVPSS